MKAVVLKRDGKIHYMDVPRPVPGRGEVLVHVKACGICGSDLRYLQGENPWSEQTLGIKTENPENIILGHEFAGDVVEVAEQSDEYLLGKKVAVIVYTTCGTCEFCRHDRMNLCKNTVHIGHGAGWGNMEYYPGGMAEYCQVWSDKVYPFEKISYEEASTLDFAAVALSSVRKIPKIFAEDAVVIGAGPIGLMAIQFLKLSGARRVYCIDVLDYSFETARQFGADDCLLVSKNTVSEILKRTEGLGVTAVLDTVGAVESQKMAFGICKVKGTIVNVASNENTVQIQLSDLYGEKSIVSVANAKDQYFYDCLKMMEAQRINVKPLLTDRLPLAQVKTGFERLMIRGQSGAIKVILVP
ncbi:alcohol dehydrogenase catalytic domain-containing protein [[Clostridium] hylemonae]|uniref:zinc-dependent alcohol dehydrogenase n=2 Tax=[Clostridium] hylemonae TaxID=89153 RepID=UPI001106DCB4|nr:alcohol dehydrogenase catalytic domain-containing protein [[Clostridium] hylemonae]MCB7521361.1 alcohol dehydrogenase catalytic domain-containing protein [[Clostridium] hylemonae]